MVPGNYCGRHGRDFHLEATGLCQESGTQGKKRRSRETRCGTSQDGGKKSEMWCRKQKKKMVETRWRQAPER
jgi:hypothetical protein